MKKITFKSQIIIGIILVVIGNILAFVFHKGVFSNIAWIVYGILFILNPVYPKSCINEKKGKIGARIGGVLCILVGLITKFIV